MPATPTLDASPTAGVVTIAREQLKRLQAELKFAQTRIAALNFEIARLKRWRFGSSSESLDAQAPLFQEILADAAVEEQAARDEQQGRGGEAGWHEEKKKRRAVRQTLPQNLPRIDHHHELTDTQCGCGQPLVRIGEDVSEQLDCEPARFFVHRHIRGKYACRCCQTVQAAALPAQIIDKGLPAAGLLAQVPEGHRARHLGQPEHAPRAGGVG